MLASTHTHDFSCHGVGMLFACFCRTDDACVCVCVSCAEGHHDLGIQQLFLEGDTSIQLQQHGQAAFKPTADLTPSDNLSATHLHTTTVAGSTTVLKDLDICLCLNSIILAGVTGEMFMKHAEGPGSPCFMLFATKQSHWQKINKNKIK